MRYDKNVRPLDHGVRIEARPTSLKVRSSQAYVLPSPCLFGKLQVLDTEQDDLSRAPAFNLAFSGCRR